MKSIITSQRISAPREGRESMTQTSECAAPVPVPPPLPESQPGRKPSTAIRSVGTAVTTAATMIGIYTGGPLAWIAGAIIGCAAAALIEWAYCRRSSVGRP